VSTPTAARRRSTPGRRRRHVAPAWAAGIGNRLGTLHRRSRDWLGRPLASFNMLLAVFFLLLGVGLLMVLSSSSVSSFKVNQSSFSVFKKQFLYALVGLVVFYVMMRVRLNWLRSMSTLALIGCFGLLLAVLTQPPINAARSWFKYGWLSFQPAELAKLVMVIWGADVLSRNIHYLGRWRNMLLPVLPVAVLMGALFMLQPDMGMTATLAVIVAALLFFAGASWKLFGGLAAVGALAFAGFALSADYRAARVVSFLNPEDDPRGKGLQLLQGLYGMGDGGLFGVGLGQSKAKWAYLPHAESDFIFAIIGEELGLIGAGLVVALFVTLAMVGLRIARRNTEPFIKLVAATSTTWLVGQAAINIFYVIGLLPVTGLTLPMISAGGTSLVVTMAIFGLLANCARREPQALAALQNDGPGPISRFFGVGVPGVESEEARYSAEKAEQRAAKKQNKEWAKAAEQRAKERARAAREDARLAHREARRRPVDRRHLPREPVRSSPPRGDRRPQPPVGRDGRGQAPGGRGRADQGSLDGRARPASGDSARSASGGRAGPRSGGRTQPAYGDGAPPAPGGRNPPVPGDRNERRSSDRVQAGSAGRVQPEFGGRVQGSGDRGQPRSGDRALPRRISPPPPPSASRGISGWLGLGRSKPAARSNGTAPIRRPGSQAVPARDDRDARPARGRDSGESGRR
jgi:cell division protein FtsW